MRLTLSASELVLEVALGVVRGTRRALEGDHRDERPAQPSWPEPSPPRPAARRASIANGTAPRTAQPRPRPAAAAPPPTTAQGDAVPVFPPPPGAKEVDDAPVPVAEFGEAGAEEDAGAEIHIDPPWNGYDDMTAAQIVDRLIAANRETVAAVALYEGMKRDRRSVARAADRRLRALANEPSV